MRLTGIENRWAEAAMGAIFPGSHEEGLADIRAMGSTAWSGAGVG